MTTTATTITVDSLPTANSVDRTQDRLLIYTASATDIQGIAPNTMLGISGVPVGTTDSQTLSTKVIDNTNTITVKDTNLTIQDDGDTTKQAKFQASGITTATTRTYTLPDITDTLVTLTATQTLTNKTLTSPVVTGGTIDNTAITVDTVSGHTVSNTGTIYGMTVTTGVLASAALAGSVNTAAIQSSAVTAAKMANGMILQRQGANTGTSNWVPGGTSNTNTSATAVFFQAGTAAYVGSDLTVTFPTAYNQKPIVIVSNQGDTSISQNSGAEVVSTTTTNFIVRAISVTGNLNIAWLAIGQ